MKLNQGSLDLSASDVSNAFSCDHRTALDLSAARGERRAPSGFNSMTAALQARGEEHERRYVEALRARGLAVVDFGELRGPKAEEATLIAMRDGSQVIVQAALRHGVWNGRADVLLRVDTPSALGAWSYEPVDTKLARETRAASILQLAFYAQLLEQAQGALPERFCVVTPGETLGAYVEQWERVSDVHAYFRFVRSMLVEATTHTTAELLEDNYPEPVEHCDVCKWWQNCEKRRREDDHLSFVAGITRLQRRQLEKNDVKTLEKLAKGQLPADFKLDRGSRESLERVTRQARIQWLGRTKNEPTYELLPLSAKANADEGAPPQGLAALPLPSSGDVFLDLEGDPFGGDRGREYLFGWAYVTDGEVLYERLWARNPAEERAAFEQFIDWLITRWEMHPALHVYHYAPYEPAALKRLMGRYATREAEIDRLLRAERFVDLYRVVRNGLIASVERYSIKDLEQFYGFERTVELREASTRLRTVEQALELGCLDAIEPEVIAAVEGYNRDDCVSALRLRDWLEERRSELEQTTGPLARPADKDGAPGEEQEESQGEAAALAARLLDGVPEDPQARHDVGMEGQWLLAHMLEFHRREAKTGWWEFFRLSALTAEELLEERAGLGGLAFVARIGGTKTAPIDRYQFVEQDYDLRDDKPLHLPSGDAVGKVHAFDRAARTVDIKKKGKHAATHPGAVFIHEQINAKPLPDALFRLGSWVAEHGIDAQDTTHRAARDLLLGRAPRLTRGAAFARKSGESTLAFAQRVALELDHTVLPIQGPPGTGKTYTAAHMIGGLLAAGKTVGVTAVSHKVVHKLLEKAIDVATSMGARVKAVAKVKEPSQDPTPFEQVKDSKRIPELVHAGEANLIGGTAWLWANEGCTGLVDVLFVDEAGQMALANVLAAAQGASSLVLIGDPQQLDQPIQGSHPDGVEVSALHHLLGAHKTVPEDRGLFLAETWRLAPAICDFTSELFYESRLLPRAGCESQALLGTQGLDGAGLWYSPCEHVGCQSSSDSEVGAVEVLVNRLLQAGAQWVDREGRVHGLRGEHILVVAPYNAQVSRLAERLAARGVRVGTVDKFQGQEAPLVIYSMTTSTPQDAPRGMEFLYSPNRLNVATSRAQCAGFLVAAPALFEPECKTVRHVQLANAFCRYLEMARRT